MKDNMNLAPRTLIITFLLLFNAMQAQAPQSETKTLQKKDWDFKLSGFIQADIIFDNKKLTYIDGYLPTYITSNAIDYNTYFTLRQSQLNLGIANTKSGISGLVQVDFIGPNNQNKIRLRKLYITYKNWLIGQDWSTLNDLNTWPNLLDFNGPNGALYARRMQIRYTQTINAYNQYAISIEDPNIPSITLPSTNLNWRKKTIFPNVVGAYKYGSKNYIRGAAIISPITYQQYSNQQSSLVTNTSIGFGVHASSVLYVNELSNFKLVGAAGTGIATNIVAFWEEGYDAVPNPNNPNELKKLPVITGVAAYEHWWNSQWSSVLFYSYSKVGKKQYMSENMFKTVQHYGLNTVYQPTSYFKAGVDFTYGLLEKYFVSHKLESARLQISTVFMF